MRLKHSTIVHLQKILKRCYGVELDEEQAQDAAKQILRFVGMKLHGEVKHESNSTSDKEAEIDKD